jgi:hypothetical protein
MAERHQPPRGCAPLTAARRRQDRRHELSGGEIAGVDGPDTGLSRRHQRTPSGGPEGGRAQGKREEPGMVTSRRIDPFLKADLLTCAPKCHEQNLPRRIPGFLPYDMGARPHMSYKPAGACNCPVVMCPFVFGTTRVEKKNHHSESVQPPCGYAPPQLRCNWRSNVRTQAHTSCNRRAGCQVQKNRTSTRANAGTPRNHRSRLKR